VSNEGLRTRIELAAELAEELDVSWSPVLRAVADLRERLGAVPGERNGRRVELYPPEAVQLIRERLLKADRRKSEASEEGEEYWQAVGSVRVAANHLAKVLAELDSAFRALRRHPPSVTRLAYTLPHPGLALIRPVAVVVAPLRRSVWRATFAEAGLEAKGKGRGGAFKALRQELVDAYLALSEDPDQNPERWNVLEQLIRERGPSRRRGAQRPMAEAPEAAGGGAGEGEAPPSLGADEQRDA
jgi:hypothetical protein